MLVFAGFFPWIPGGMLVVDASREGCDDDDDGEGGLCGGRGVEET